MGSQILAQGRGASAAKTRGYLQVEGFDPGSAVGSAVGFKGAFKSADPAKHLGKITALLNVVAVLNPDSATAEQYARASVALEAKGQPIPENDLWIAAVALELDMPLAKRDSHFDRIDGLALIRW